MRHGGVLVAGNARDEFDWEVASAQPDVLEAKLATELVGIGVKCDKAVLAAAQTLLKLVDRAGADRGQVMTCARPRRSDYRPWAAVLEQLLYESKAG
ncbi:hypothetical protein WEI85_19875 [Actinomycetes bacterium KLBMP 9797]